MSQLLWHLLAGKRGGTMRLRIIDELVRAPTNAHQLATHLGVDYRTAQHHVGVLVDNGLVLRPKGGAYAAVLRPSRVLIANLDTVEEIRSHLKRAAERAGAPLRRAAPAAGGE